MNTITRRSLLGVTAVAAAAGAGVAGWFTVPGRHRPRTPVVLPPPRSPVLETALARERALIARLDVTAVAHPALAARIRVLRVDHQAHLGAIVALLEAAGVSPSSPAPSASQSGASQSGASPSASAPPTVSGPPPFTGLPTIIAAERAAATAAAAASLRTTGTAAVTLASLSASEATHAAWLA